MESCPGGGLDVSTGRCSTLFDPTFPGAAAGRLAVVEPLWSGMPFSFTLTEWMAAVAGAYFAASCSHVSKPRTRLRQREHA